MLRALVDLVALLAGSVLLFLAVDWKLALGIILIAYYTKTAT